MQSNRRQHPRQEEASSKHRLFSRRSSVVSIAEEAAPVRSRLRGPPQMSTAPGPHPPETLELSPTLTCLHSSTAVLLANHCVQPERCNMAKHPLKIRSIAGIYNHLSGVTAPARTHSPALVQCCTFIALSATQILRCVLHRDEALSELRYDCCLACSG